MRYAIIMLTALALGGSRETGTSEEAYARWIRTSDDFAPVARDREMFLDAWPGWLYLPWSYRWTLPYNPRGARWTLDHGYNGAFLDHGQTRVNEQDKLAWIDKHGLKFYVDHVAGKGDLHLWDGGKEAPYRAELRSPGVRPRPVNADLAERLKGIMAKRIARVRASPNRAAYALDDEVSWGHFTQPCMWNATDDEGAYARWLGKVYGSEKPTHPPRFTTPDGIWPKLSTWCLAEFDASPLLDQWTFNDTVWLNLVGDLVNHANRLDPETPCGLVGIQGPSPFGGYDLARLAEKIQFAEAYDIGSALEILRSFDPTGAAPRVTTHFHRLDPARPGNATDDVWQVWYRLGQGLSGFIGWVEGWFDPDTGEPLPWHDALAPHLKEAARLAPLVRGAEWLDDGVALYYQHPSIQLGWILDAEAHKRTWRNRFADHRLGSSHLVRRAWEGMLRDEGLQFRYLSYLEVIRTGVPETVRVLVLPAVLCLSEGEARAIEAFCRRGGTVIADYLPGLFDPHGRGRKDGGALDGLFGVRHGPDLRAKDVFQERLWTETDQDRHYDYTDYETLIRGETTCLEGPCGFHRALRTLEGTVERSAGRGRAVLMNLSPQRYLAYRTAGSEASRRRAVFMAPLRRAGVAPLLKVEGDPEVIHRLEITRWQKAGRITLFLCHDVERHVASTGSGSRFGLSRKTATVRLRFAEPVRDLKNERTGERLGEGTVFEAEWTRNEALVLSFRK